jgi:hypothetical protein
VIAAALLALAALIPQVHLYLARGREWRGAYAYFYSDEPAYAAYLNALIEGRPRRNDPYTGADDDAQHTDADDQARYPNPNDQARPTDAKDQARPQPLPESLFSIQFAPAYLLALPARALGLDTATVFILLMPLVAVGCALAIFWIVASVTGDEGAATATVFVVLCLGILISAQGFIINLLGGFSGYIFLPFLRRYVPGVSLVFFFAFCGATWHALTRETQRARTLWSVASGALFALLVYSYFYHWTAAAAFLACVVALWLALRPREERRRACVAFAIVGAIAIVSLVPYFVLLSHRAPSSDETQALTHTRAPDLFRGVELVAACALAAIFYAARRKVVSWRERETIFTVALALSVFIVFNQQTLTGLSLQPMHYEQYIGNYVALLALALASTLVYQGATRRRRVVENDDVKDAETRIRETNDLGTTRRLAASSRALVPHKFWIALALCALAWGALESWETSRALLRQNEKHDDWYAVVRRLDALSRASGSAHPVVFNPDDFRMDQVPAASRCAVVWAPHTFSYSSITRAEDVRRVFQFLHFSGVAPRDFAAAGRDQGFLQFSVFGWERANPRLAVEFHPVTTQEIAAAQRDYTDYVSALARSTQPPEPSINFVIVSDDQPFNLANLEHFYALEQIERIGAHTIYRATPKR